jgi:pimeloyl-ACP methyl ester carboxylesterase
MTSRGPSSSRVRPRLLDHPESLAGRLPPSEMYPAHDARVTARFTTLASGLRVRLIECGPRNGVIVLCLHGWGASSYTYRDNLPSLAAAGFRAVAVDLKGHGLSDKPIVPGGYAFEAMLAHVGDIIEVVNAEAPANAPRPMIVAQSMTGALALELAVETTPRIARVALINPVGLCAMPLIPFACALTPSPTVRVAPWLVRRWAMSAGLRLVYGDPRRVKARQIDEYWAPSQFPGYSMAMRALVHEFHWPPFAAERLGALRVPVLTILGSRDRVVRGARPVAERLPGSRLVIVPGGGHAVNEELPEVVNPVLVGFLGEGG